jgi:hypothetical protein
MKLNPNTDYCFSEADYAFCIELAKVGHVHLLSCQVSLTSKGGISFIERVGEKKVAGLTLPDNWCIEYIGSSPVDQHHAGITITFGVKTS